MSKYIKIRNAVKKYGDQTIISNLSLDIKEGEFFTLLGPSGCGKTTLLRMIAGFNSIEGGDFYFGETRINDIDPAKRNIGMVFQNYAIFPNMNVEKNVAFGLKNRKLPKDEIKSKTDEFLKLMKIDEYRDRMPERLSGGQQQRTAIARAIANKPKILIADEPTGNLDPKKSNEIIKLFEKINREEKTTIIIVTHDIETVRKHPKRTIEIKNGHIVRDKADGICDVRTTIDKADTETISLGDIESLKLMEDDK